MFLPSTEQPAMDLTITFPSAYSPPSNQITSRTFMTHVYRAGC